MLHLHGSVPRLDVAVLLASPGEKYDPFHLEKDNFIFSISFVSSACPSFILESVLALLFLGGGDINTDLAEAPGAPCWLSPRSVVALSNETIHISLTLG